MTPALLFENVIRRYDKVLALNRVNLRVDPGEIVAVLGTNGAGKSTMMNIAAGLRQADEGRVQILGHPPTNISAKKIRGCLLQDMDFPAHLKVKEIVNLVQSHFPEYTQTQDWLEQLELRPLMGRLTVQMSGGERRKLGLLCALAGNPRLALLDEPTANVDLLGQNQIRQLLIEHFRNSERALVFSSHHMHEVAALADRVIILKKGEIIYQDRVEALKKRMGLKKVRFRPSTKIESLKSASTLRKTEDMIEVYGTDSDDMLREIFKLDEKASQIEVTWPDLEESILQIWGMPS